MRKCLALLSYLNECKPLAKAKNVSIFAGFDRKITRFEMIKFAVKSEVIKFTSASLNRKKWAKISFRYFYFIFLL